MLSNYNLYMTFEARLNLLEEIDYLSRLLSFINPTEYRFRQFFNKK